MAAIATRIGVVAIISSPRPVSASEAQLTRAVSRCWWRVVRPRQPAPHRLPMEPQRRFSIASSLDSVFALGHTGNPEGGHRWSVSLEEDDHFLTPLEFGHTVDNLADVAFRDNPARLHDFGDGSGVALEILRDPDFHPRDDALLGTLADPATLDRLHGAADHSVRVPGKRFDVPNLSYSCVGCQSPKGAATKEHRFQADRCIRQGTPHSNITARTNVAY